MTLNKMTGAAGVEYLMRQVATNDGTHHGRADVANYYTEKGEAPGVFMGSGLECLGGIAEGDTVSHAQIRNLMLQGLHPNADQMRRQINRELKSGERTSITKREVQSIIGLGAKHSVVDGASEFNRRLHERYRAYNLDLDLDAEAPIADEIKSQLRTEVADALFLAENGRLPQNDVERQAIITIYERVPVASKAVIGFDLTFSPVKSVSAVWAVASKEVAEQIEEAHHEAVRKTLKWLEDNVAYTREGKAGARQVDVNGLIAMGFTHRDTRAGDPDLHTHLVIANKVQAKNSGKWLTLDGRVIHQAIVSGSETYNTLLEKEIQARLPGVVFGERERTTKEDKTKRGVREIVGVDLELIKTFSQRREAISEHYDTLAIDFQDKYGRSPNLKEQHSLRQQANLATRAHKHDPRALEDQRAEWGATAVATLGTQEAVDEMIANALAPKPSAAQPADEMWRIVAAEQIAITMSEKHSTWKFWHVYAEAQRMVRLTSAPLNQVDEVCDDLVKRVLGEHSIAVHGREVDATIPAELLRADGTSVYTVAGSDLYTSHRILDAEHRIIEHAGRTDGRVVPEEAVEAALARFSAERSTPTETVEANAGQANAVFQLATSGKRVQLLVAPAGSGKTTTMAILADAWTATPGNHVLGLAPSAVAAKGLGTELTKAASTAYADTLAKLAFSIKQHQEEGTPLPEWVNSIGEGHLVVIDEVGMAETLTLDAVIDFLISRGASVRLVGDHQQLSAVGAGGVMRDIDDTYGAVWLNELRRFNDTAEAAATLSLREGDTSGIGFYLDNSRVHIGTMAAMIDEVFRGWQDDNVTFAADKNKPLMLAPTRDLAAALNKRARESRLALEGAAPGAATVALRDGNTASVGDLIITRENKRRLMISETDWVKNGDRWTITEILANGDVKARHAEAGLTVRLPADYVTAQTELGYACTIHTAQGVTASSMRGVFTGEESRQSFYTAMSRGTGENHAYFGTVGDGDGHRDMDSDVLNPETASELFAKVLGRDGAQKSATTEIREAADPAILLGEVVAQYADYLTFAAEQVIGAETVARIENGAEALVPDVTEQSAWAVLRAHLIMIAAAGDDPLREMSAAVDDRALTNAGDTAAVLDWRLDSTGLRNVSRGPLEWLHGIPALVADDAERGTYLASLSARITSLADQVRARAEADTHKPVWARGGISVTPQVLGDVAVWRAANRVEESDERALGQRQLQKLASNYQRKLNRLVAGDRSPAVREWRMLLADVAPAVGRDPFLTTLAERLATMSRIGLPADQFVVAAAAEGDLPAEYAASALWFRISRFVESSVAADLDANAHVTTAQWTEDLDRMLGTTNMTLAQLQDDEMWPALVSTVNHGLAKGWSLTDLLQIGAPFTPLPDDVDVCQALVWRASVALLEEAPAEDAPDFNEAPHDLYDGVEHDEPVVVDQQHVWEPNEAPADLYDGWFPDEDHITDVDVPEFVEDDLEAAAVDYASDVAGPTGFEADLDRTLFLKSMIRDYRVIEEEILYTEAEMRRELERAEKWDHATVSRARFIEANNVAALWFERQFGTTENWARPYLQDRFGRDLAFDPHYRPGFAPEQWRALVTHMRSEGFTNEELVATDLARINKNGNLYDRYRDRLVLPIRVDGDTIGFSARRNPKWTKADEEAGLCGPKYLNSSDSALFHKSAQLYIANEDLIADGATPVITEGVMDAIAITEAGQGRYVGVAPLGTSLTVEQAIALARLFQRTGIDPLVATDMDLAGQVAAERDFWMLSGVGLAPGYVQMPAGFDPADLLHTRGADALEAALQRSRPLGEVLLDERFAHLSPDQLRTEVPQVLAAGPTSLWDDGLARYAARLSLSDVEAQKALILALETWESDPRRRSLDAANGAGDVKKRMETNARQSVTDVWAPVAAEVDPRLVGGLGWDSLAARMQEIHDAGYAVGPIMRDLAPTTDLDDEAPAQRMLFKLVATVPLDSPGSGSADAATYGTLPPTGRRGQHSTLEERDQKPRRNGPAV